MLNVKRDWLDERLSVQAKRMIICDGVSAVTWMLYTFLICTSFQNDGYTIAGLMIYGVLVFVIGEMVIINDHLKTRNVEINDPTLAFGRYLFDKKE